MRVIYPHFSDRETEVQGGTEQEGLGICWSLDVGEQRGGRLPGAQVRGEAPPELGAQEGSPLSSGGRNCRAQRPGERETRRTLGPSSSWPGTAW